MGQKKASPEHEKPEELQEVIETRPLEKEGKIDIDGNKRTPVAVDLKAPPSTFASVIVGDTTHIMTSEPSHLASNSIDVMKVYGQDLTEAFDFAAPSPDDVIQNAQSASKGLAIRRHI